MDEAQLRDVERLASIRLGGANDPNTSAADAEAQLLRLESSSEYVPQCQFILDNTASPFAQHIASHCLESLMTKFWNNFSVEQKLEIRNYVLMFLHQRTTTLDNFVIKKITTLFCRVTKLGWFDGVEHRDIINDVQKFVEGTIDHHIIGLEILNALIQEMNIQNPNRTLTQHRKTAVSFRDHALYPAFTMGISTLKNLQMGAIQVPPGKEKSLETLAHSGKTNMKGFISLYCWHLISCGVVH
jgi:exportin-7